VDVRENIPSKREAWTRITFQERNKWGKEEQIHFPIVGHFGLKPLNTQGLWILQLRSRHNFGKQITVTKKQVCNTNFIFCDKLVGWVSVINNLRVNLCVLYIIVFKIVTNAFINLLKTARHTCIGWKEQPGQLWRSENHQRASNIDLSI
jgi:hypothetical protein